MDKAIRSKIGCICAIRGYCADVLDDPLGCSVCVTLHDDDECPAELLIEAFARRSGPAWQMLYPATGS